MVFFLGTVGLIFITTIPGFLVLRALALLPPSPVARCLYVFATSLVINSVVVHGLYGAYLYRRWVVVPAVLSACAYFAWTTRTLRWTFSPYALAFGGDRGAVLAARWAALTAIAGIAWMAVSFFGYSFRHVDDVLSWDRWAMEFYNGDLSLSGYYPLLVPANWSLVYQLLGVTDVKLFNRALMSLFCLGLLLTCFDLPRVRLAAPLAAYCASLLCGVYLFYCYDPLFLTSGYMEVAAAFFAFGTLYASADYMTLPPEKRQSRTALLVPSAFAAGALMTKQSGIYIFALYLLWLLWLLIRTTRGRPIASRGAIGIAVVLILVVVYPMMRNHVLTNYGSSSNIGYLISDIHAGRTLPQRWTWAANLVLDARGPAYGFVPKVALVLTAVSCTTAIGAAITLLVVIPYYTLWALLFSYELRTMVTVVPFAALTSGIGVDRLVGILRGTAGRWWPIAAAAIAAIGIVLLRGSLRTAAQAPWSAAVVAVLLPLTFAVSIAVLVTRLIGPRPSVRIHPTLLMAIVIVACGVVRLRGLSDRAIIAQQHEQQALLGDVELNRRLMRYFREHPEPARVASEYYYFGVVPEIMWRSRLIHFPQNFNLADVERVLTAVPGSRYLMFVDAKRPPATREAMNRAGYSDIFCKTPFCFVRVPDSSFHP